MKRTYILMTLLAVMALLYSCETHSRLLGRWETVSIIQNGYEYDLARGEYEQYIFYDNGTGLYINEFGTRVDFYWDERSYGKLSMRFSDGIVETPYYEFDGNYLILWDNSMRRDGRVFRYTGGAHW